MVKCTHTYHVYMYVFAVCNLYTVMHLAMSVYFRKSTSHVRSTARLMPASRMILTHAGASAAKEAGGALQSSAATTTARGNCRIGAINAVKNKLLLIILKYDMVAI